MVSTLGLNIVGTHLGIRRMPGSKSALFAGSVISILNIAALFIEMFSTQDEEDGLLTNLPSWKIAMPFHYAYMIFGSGEYSWSDALVDISNNRRRCAEA